MYPEVKYKPLLLTTLLIVGIILTIHAQEDTTKKPFRPFYLFCENLAISYGTATWYDLNGSLTLRKSGNTLTLGGSADNFVKSGSSYKELPQTQPFEHNFASSDIYFGKRGTNIYRTGYVSYFFDNGEKLKIQLKYSRDKNDQKFKDTIYRKHTAIIPGSNYLRGSDDISLLHNSQEFYFSLAADPGRKDKNKFIMTTKFLLPQNIHQVVSSASSFSATDTVLNTVRNNLNDTTSGYEFNTILTYSNDFKKSWLWIKIEVDQQDKKYTSGFFSFYDYALTPDTLQMTVKQEYSNRSLSGSLVYDPTDGKINWPALTLIYAYRESHSFRHLDSGNVIQTDPFFTNKTDLFSTSLKPGIDWRTKYGKKVPVSIKMYYDIRHHNNFESFPSQDFVKRSYKNLFAEASVSFPMVKNKPLVNVSYVSSSGRPGIELLQPYMDIAIPFVWGTGNNSLQQSVSHKASISYDGKGSKKKFVLKTAMEFVYTTNPIRASAVWASLDTLLQNTWKIPQGTVFYAYKNFSYEKKGNANVTLEIPVRKLSSNLILNPLFNYLYLPASLNEKAAGMEQTRYSGRFSWKTTLKYGLSFSLLYWQDNNYIRSDIASALSGKYINRTGQFNFDWVPKKKKLDDFLFSLNYSIRTYEGLPGATDRVISILTPKITFYRIKETRLQLDLEFFDLLNQNKYFQRRVTPFYTEDRLSTAMGRTLIIRMRFQPGFLNRKSIERKKTKHD